MKIIMFAFLCMYLSVFSSLFYLSIPPSMDMMTTTPLRPEQTTFTNITGCQSLLLQCVKTFENCTNRPLGLSGFCSSDINQICHSLTGNHIIENLAMIYVIAFDF